MARQSCKVSIMSSDLTTTSTSAKPLAVTEQQAELIDLVLSTSWTQARIAEHLNTDPAWVNKTLKKQHVREAMNTAIQDGMTLGAARAFSKINQLIDHKSGYVALEASKDMLDRAGFKPVDRSQVAVGGDISIKIDLGG